MTGPPRRSAMYNLGAFFRGVLGGFTADTGGGVRREVRREVQQHEGATPQGQVTLRRTTIEEVEIRPRTDTGDAQQA